MTYPTTIDHTKIHHDLNKILLLISDQELTVPQINQEIEDVGLTFGNPLSDILHYALEYQYLTRYWENGLSYYLMPY